jgi:antitoxin (DNA-binding transcriptional repressor) of toxin-antitoxin stability system
MKVLSVSDFREQGLQLLDALPAEGVVITKRGRPISKITPAPASCSDLIGSIKDLTVSPQDDLFSTEMVRDAESAATSLKTQIPL